MIELDHPTLPITRQCALVGLSRSAFYSGPRIESAENLALMRAIDEQFMETPWYGSRQMARHLRRHGHGGGRKRVRRLMARMGLAAVYQRPKTTDGAASPAPGLALSAAGSRHRPARPGVVRRHHPRLRGGRLYIPMRRGFLYLVAIMDWFSRRVLAWRLSNTMEADFCIEAIEEAMCRFRFVRPLVPGLARPSIPISARPLEPGPSPAGGVVLVRVVDRQAVARARRMRRRLSPASSRRWALWTRRSRIASAKVGWSIAACQSATGSWLVTIVERRP
jgi:hypothetical protein